ncbi:MAG: indolepyruvate ferredoxin oxidoreductase subunit alpha [Planctomycetes bacterium]|nr:indolepyruvate ferredoxin oxidoreductase subunit alpha [Planctomycetota bacterium]
MEATDVKSKVLLSGNEAIARGVWEAGAKFASAYPGTPSTEIVENIKLYKEIFSQWSPNEKTAFEAAFGAAVGGHRSLAAMKHVGLNVAMDPFMTSAQAGVNAGFVIVVADDPAMHSSQNEQDSRILAKFGRVGMLEPADSQDSLEFVKLAFELSEKFNLPFIVRMTTRVSHSKSLVKISERVEVEDKEFDMPFQRFVMLPGNARVLNVEVEKKLANLREFSEEFNRKGLRIKDKKIGVVTSSVASLYAMEAYPEASMLKLSMTNPIPEKLLKEFSETVDEVLVIEELLPFIEDEMLRLGCTNVKGQELFSKLGELNVETISPKDNTDVVEAKKIEMPSRPPVLCAGCSHRGAFTVLKQLKAIVSGDIGCYTLGALPPIQKMNSCLCMGASLGIANGLYRSMPEDKKDKLVALIGDSTFWHSGMAGLLDAVYNDMKYTLVILDNSTTAMTGHQDNPSTGKHVDGSPAPKTSFVEFAKSIGVQYVEKCNPLDLTQTKEVIKGAMEFDGIAVVIAVAPCVTGDRSAIMKPYVVDAEKCTACGVCFKIGCPAIIKEIDSGKAIIDPILCTGCSICAQVCKFDAISQVD